MSTLTEILNADGVRPTLIKDCVTLIEGEVKRKKGATGFAIRKGFQLVHKLENGRMIEKAVNLLLDEFVEALNPYYADYVQMNTNNQPGFAQYINERDETVTDSLLAVTDNRRQEVSKKMLAQTYDKMRPMARKHVLEAIPALGDLMQKYTEREPVVAV